MVSTTQNTEQFIKKYIKGKAMAKEHNKTVKTPKGKLMYVTITGDGRNGAMKGQPENMQFMASIILKKDSAEFKAFKANLDDIWKVYATSMGVKGAPKSNGIKPVTINSDELDEYGTPKKIETDEVIITFKTGITWPDGKAKVIDVFQPSGSKCTDAIHKADWSIGNGTIGIIHGMASPNDIGGTHKISLYLSAVQFAGDLVKYTGGSVDADAIDGAEDIALDLDLDTDIPEI
jgi:hypothetical protein